MVRLRLNHTLLCARHPNSFINITAGREIITIFRTHGDQSCTCTGQEIRTWGLSNTIEKRDKGDTKREIKR